MHPILMAVLLFGSPTAKSAPAQTGDDWKIAGWEVTTCCCQDICPCRFNEKPTHMECEGLVSIHVETGYFGETKLDGVSFILASRGFDDNGPGWNKLYVDKNATPAQQKAIG